MDDSLPGPGLAQELTKLTRLDRTSQGRVGLHGQAWSVQGPSLGAWSEEQPQAHPKEFNSSSTGRLAALQARGRCSIAQRGPWGAGERGQEQVCPTQHPRGGASRGDCGRWLSSDSNHSRAVGRCHSKEDPPE